MLPALDRTIIVHSLRAIGHSISIKPLSSVMIPIFEEVPDIFFQNPYLRMGHNCSNTGEKLWKIMNDECYTKLAPHKSIIQMALRNFPENDRWLQDNNTDLYFSKTHYLLGDIHENNACKVIKEGFVSGHIKRENIYYEKTTTRTRKMAIKISSNQVVLYWSLCVQF